MGHYVRPMHDVKAINAAGRAVVAAPEWDVPLAAKEIIDNWRAAHQYPLNSFAMTLRNRAFSIQRKPLIAQRVKRFASIRSKLIASPDMKLSQMQDIGGCRVVLADVELVRELIGLYFERPLTHKFIGIKDYIADPKETGYRGVHLKYRYAGRGKNVTWEGLKIEIQVRTKLQHMWATAVEAASTFTNAALKSNRGSAAWLRFFALMSSVFAMREGIPLVPGTPRHLGDLIAEIRLLNEQRHIVNAFADYSAIMPHIEGAKEAAYFLVTLNPNVREVSVRGFRKTESEAASRAYSQAESSNAAEPATQVVLVSVSSITTLKQAYPNYFLDTQAFLQEVNRLLDLMAIAERDYKRPTPR